jgi:hypothetical protein
VAAGYVLWPGTRLLASLGDPRCDSLQQAVEPECEAVVSGQVRPGREVLSRDAGVAGCPGGPVTGRRGRAARSVRPAGRREEESMKCRTFGRSGWRSHSLVAGNPRWRVTPGGVAHEPRQVPRWIFFDHPINAGYYA